MSLRRLCTITGVGNVKQVSFKPGPEDCYRRCGSDKIRQTGGRGWRRQRPEEVRYAEGYMPLYSVRQVWK